MAYDKVIDSAQLEAEITATANAIREKTGDTALIDWLENKGFADVIAGIESGGGNDDVLDALIDRSITEITSNVTSIGVGAFASCLALTTVDFPVATSIGNAAFEYCYALTTVDFPVATSIGVSAFEYCKVLTTVDFPVVTSIGNYAFQYCYVLTTVNFPVVTSIGNEAFRYCEVLTTVDFPVATSIGTRTFNGCSALTSLILRSETMATLASINAFTSSGIASGTGYIYVPSALVDSYKAATNWSTYANQFRALEDYTVDGTITGELDPTKI